MQVIWLWFQNSAVSRLYNSFSPAGRAVIWLALPFFLLDAVHYYTAGIGLVFSLPLLVLAYLGCGLLAAGFAHQEGRDAQTLPAVGRSAGFLLWLTSTMLNSLAAFFLGLASLGTVLLSSASHLCLFAIPHGIASMLVGWTGGWLYQRLAQRAGNS